MVTFIRKKCFIDFCKLICKNVNRFKYADASRDSVLLLDTVQAIGRNERREIFARETVILISNEPRDPSRTNATGFAPTVDVLFTLAAARSGRVFSFRASVIDERQPSRPGLSNILLFTFVAIHTRSSLSRGFPAELHKPSVFERHDSSRANRIDL